MLAWLTGSDGEEYTGFTGDSKLHEAPETPAPVFAYRAFRSAVLGTPAAEEDEDKDLTIPIRPLNAGQYRQSDELLKSIGKSSLEETQKMHAQKLAPKPQAPAQPMGSPTKSILLTPGAAATRRKTVSFGEGVVDNERRRTALVEDDQPEPTSGNISRQWSANLSDMPKRNRSKLTQSLLEAREQKVPEKEDELFDISNKDEVKHEENDAQSGKEDVQAPTQDDEDETTNLNAPHSQSGIYWKSEFESYRMKTEREIKKLIQYRSVAKSYAKKKESEALRLADKLKQEETKVAQMERHVSELAAGMIGDTQSEASKRDEMVRELSHQTAIALQYKQKVNTLKKTLQRHGVVDSSSELQNQDAPMDGNEHKLRKVEQALEDANAQIKSTNKNTNLKELQGLVETSERKASDLEKENQTLKRSLARFKDEMSKYEQRRKSKEARLKQREQKMESRVQEYSSRIKESTKSHRELEEALKQSFAIEKEQMQETIDSLKLKLYNGSHDVHERNDPSLQSRAALQDDFYGKENYEAKRRPELDTLREQERDSLDQPETRHKTWPNSRRQPSKRSSHVFNNTEDIENDLNQTPSGNPSKSHRNRSAEYNTKPPKDYHTHIELDENPLTESEELPQGPRSPRRRTITHSNNPRSTNPPFIQKHETGDQKPLSISPTKSTGKQRPGNRAVLSPRPSMVYLPSNRAGPNVHPRKQRGKGYPHSMGSNGHNARVTISTATDPSHQFSLAQDGSVLSRLETMPADRIAAAKERLKQKRFEARRARTEGKENVCVA